jgi:hypothetical protein
MQMRAQRTNKKINCRLSCQMIERTLQKSAFYVALPGITTDSIAVKILFFRSGGKTSMTHNADFNGLHAACQYLTSLNSFSYYEF